MLRRNNTTNVTIRQQVHAGGEGKVCTIAEDNGLLAKLYHTLTPAHADKLRAMIKIPAPQGCAWPKELLTNEQRQVVGYLMPKITGAVPAIELYNPLNRRRADPTFTWQYLVCAAMNYTRTIANLHRSNLVVGDIGNNNLLVHRDATTTLVDCDSIQVPRHDGNGFHRCTVGTDEYTPPELYGKDFAAIDRTVHHDAFGTSVLVFRLIMEGAHPFAGRWTGLGDPPALADKIRQGHWPYERNHYLEPPPGAPPISILPPGLRRLCKQAFVDGHKNPSARPAPGEWHQALATLLRQLRQCPANKRHWYSDHLGACPWCERTKRVGTDTFPTPTTPGSYVVALPTWAQTPQSHPGEIAALNYKINEVCKRQQEELSMSLQPILTAIRQREEELRRQGLIP